MLHLCGFTDEIGPDLFDQITTAQACGLSGIELRSIDGTNVLQFTGDKRAEYKKQLDDAGLKVISIGSPCGKVPIDHGDGAILDMFKAALDSAQHFDAKLIRVFSFYPAGGEGQGELDPIKDKVAELMARQAELLAGTDVTMVHENEKGIFGDIGRRCVELMEAVPSEKLKCAFDFANFVQCGTDPQEYWPKLADRTAHIHIKDSTTDGHVVPAGEGAGGIAPILKDAYARGYRGYVSLEPHLKVAGHSHGETGPELFKVAADALRNVCREIDVPLEGA
jgi:sugar phosphate isomerase/epimerase